MRLICWTLLHIQQESTPWCLLKYYINFSWYLPVCSWRFFDKFPPKTLSQIYYFGDLVFNFGKRNSDRSIPSFNSRNGFTTLTNKSGTDMIGTELVCLLVLSMDFSKNNLYGCTNGPTDQTLDIYRNIIQDLLIYAE